MALCVLQHLAGGPAAIGPTLTNFPPHSPRLREDLPSRLGARLRWTKEDGFAVLKLARQLSPVQPTSTGLSQHLKGVVQGDPALGQGASTPPSNISLWARPGQGGKIRRNQ